MLPPENMAMESRKIVHSIILDSSPLLVNEPSLSTLLAKSEKLYTIPQVLAEIRDKNARARLEATILPFVTVRSPNPTSVKVISDFARRTGDLVVLSSTDIHLIAMAYELECEMNLGDWRLRKLPGQKGLNGPPPTRASSDTPQTSMPQDPDHASMNPGTMLLESDLRTSDQSFTKDQLVDDVSSLIADPGTLGALMAPKATLESDLSPETAKGVEISSDMTDDDVAMENASDSDSEDLNLKGWITPSNIKRHQSKDQNADVVAASEKGMIQVATITSDFAMQNVLLQMNLNLLSPSLLRIRQLKTYILRCHACFEKTKDMTKQFCQRCGKPTLTRVACSTNSKGEFQIHLKKNMQWNTRGDRFSIPKPVSGNANGKVGTGKGGGKRGWGQQLILAEDQKEYLQAMTGQNRRKERNLMDNDYLPDILTGGRTRLGGLPKLGGGRNINSKKR